MKINKITITIKNNISMRMISKKENGNERKKEKKDTFIE